MAALVNQSPLTVDSDLVTSFKGGLFDKDAVTAAMETCDAAMHLVGIIEEKPSKNITFERMHIEATGRVIDAAKAAGVRRYLHMSALGTRPDAVSDYTRPNGRRNSWCGTAASPTRCSGLRSSTGHGASL